MFTYADGTPWDVQTFEQMDPVVPLGAVVPVAGTDDTKTGDGVRPWTSLPFDDVESWRTVHAAASTIVEGVPLRFDGNSYGTQVGEALAIYFDRLRRRMRALSWFNAGVSGYLMADVCQRVYGSFTAASAGTADSANAAPTAVAGTFPNAPLVGGVVVLDALRNDAGYDGVTASGGTSAKARAAASNALDAYLRCVRAGSRIDSNDSGITYGGTWGLIGGLTNVSGGTINYTTGVGDPMSRTLTVPASGEVDVVLLGIDNAANGNVAGAPYKITCTGRPDVTGTTSDQHRKTGSGPNSAFSQLVVPLTGLTPGATVTITVQKTGPADASQLFFDAFLLASATPPTVVVVKPAYLTAAGYGLYGAVGASRAKDDTYAALVDTVLARFPRDASVVSVSPNASGFNPAVHLGPDGLHLNDAGNAFHADLILDRLNRLRARPGLVRV